LQAQREKRKQHKKRWPADKYKVLSYGRAISRAIEKHNEGKPAEERLPRWHTHQLRHLRAREVERAVGLHAARACLGHQEPSMTAHYSGIDIGLASEVMSKIG
jgi:hypothetical protein